MTAAPLYLWTVYGNPLDYPGKFVVRRFRVQGVGLELENRPWSVTGSLDEARATVPPGLFRLEREPGDQPQIVETWF